MPKVHKRVTIAKSGVYIYSPGSLAGLGLSLPPEKKSQPSFRVYRSAEVLAKNKDKFTQLPLTLVHPPVFVDGNNFRNYVQGYTGDTVDVRQEKNVAYLDSTVTIFDNEALNAYWRGIVEVSPGYNGKFVWESGVSPEGEPYDIVMKDISEVNHLALVKQGRGGPSACVWDGREVLVMPKRSGLFYAIRKRLSGVQDDKKGSFSAQLSVLVDQRTKLSDEEQGIRIGHLMEEVDYFPESEEKNQLSAFVQDLMTINQETEESVKTAERVIGKLYSRLDKAAMDKVSLVLDSEDYKEEASTEEKPSEAPPAKAENKDGDPPAKPEGGDKTPPAVAPAPEPATPSALDQPKIGLDDSIFDKKESELTDEECEYLHQCLMEMVKAYKLSQMAPGKPPVDAAAPAAGPGSAGAGAPPEGAPGHEESETTHEESQEAAEKPAEEKKEAVEGTDKGKDNKVEDSKDLMPPMPLDDNRVSEQGVDLDAFFKRLKGGK